MSLSLKQSAEVAKMAQTLYSFLPASGNRNTSFPLAADRKGLGQYWEHNSKEPAIRDFVTKVLLHESHKLVPFLEEVVGQAITWRGPTPERSLKREEVEALSGHLSRLGYKSKELSDQDLLSSLPSAAPIESDTQNTTIEIVPKKEVKKSLKDALLAISKKEPQAKGFAFEKFLNQAFDAYDLKPKESFRNKGEQIDGSFEHASANYLLEAKWTNSSIGQSDLLVFKGKIDGKATWTRGLFISYSGFSADGLAAFARGKPTNVICMDGYDLTLVLDDRIGLADAIALKARRASETNEAFVSLRDLV